MRTDIERITEGLKILAKYKPNATPFCKSNATWMMELQEGAFAELSEADRMQLQELGWRCRASKPYCWFLLTTKGLAAEKETPSLFS